MIRIPGPQLWWWSWTRTTRLMMKFPCLLTPTVSVVRTPWGTAQLTPSWGPGLETATLYWRGSGHWTRVSAPVPPKPLAPPPWIPVYLRLIKCPSLALSAKTEILQTCRNSLVQKVCTQSFRREPFLTKYHTWTLKQVHPHLRHFHSQCH